MPKKGNSALKKAARELAEKEDIPYTEALRRLCGHGDRRGRP